jgi:hypothetical protein
LYGFPVYRVVVWVLCLQSCCMGSRLTELLYGFSVYRVVAWVLGSLLLYEAFSESKLNQANPG